MTNWSNWAGNETATPQAVHRPTSIAEVSGAIGAATRAGKRLRTWGNGHSFTAIAATDDHAIDLSRFRGVTDVDMTLRQVTVLAGTTIRELNAALDTLGLALINMGDIDKQTVSGAISTGTHGTGAALGGLATQVSALELVLADTSVVTCSEVENPELFAAARVGLGVLGVITKVTFQAVPAFVLHAREAPDRLDAVLERVDDDASGNDHFEFFWFPHGQAVLTKRNNRLPAGSEPEPLSRRRQYVEYELIENKLFGALCRAERAVPRLVRPLQKVIASSVSERAYSDVSHKVFVTDRDVRFVESEYAVPRESLTDVLAELRGVVDGIADPIAFPVEVRFAAADDIWLSTAYGRDSAYIAIHQFLGMPYREYFDAFESIVGNVGGRPHWGKMHTLDADTLRTRYPKFDDFGKVRADVDPGGLFGNPYIDRVLG